jgi:anti-sigma regulatory factor (Ser/Thr protein kinase)
MFDRQELQVELTSGMAAAAQGRSAVGALVADAPRSFVFDATLATSELITNALLHGYGAVELFAWFDRRRGRLRVEVSDSSSELPRLVEPAPDRVGGLGLGIIAALSSAWGSFPNQRGKTVWFELTQSSGDGDGARS